MTLAEVLTYLGGGGGVAVAIYVIGTLYKALQDRWTNRQQDRQLDVSERSASISDAATANTLLLATIDAMHKENDRLTRTNLGLEQQLIQKNEHIETLQAEITTMQKNLTRMYDQLEAAKLPISPPNAE